MGKFNADFYIELKMRQRHKSADLIQQLRINANKHY